MKPSKKDLAFMQMAFSLAEQAKGQTSPNPCVGAVVVKDHRVVGWGYHQEAGQPHAEIIALEKAGAMVKGATLYLTLEPCVHWGKTPPCVDRLVSSGLKRVVIASYDPNPLVYRKGVARLKSSGIEVIAGFFQEKHHRLNEKYEKFVTSRIPFVCLKAALSLDGKIAAASGDSKWISSDESRYFAQNLRAEYDAILVGINTVLKDDPELTVRLDGWKKKKWNRIILDPNLRLPLKARLLKNPTAGQVIVFCSQDAPKSRENKLRQKQAEIIRLRTRGGLINLEEVLRELGFRDISSVLVEGGTRVLTSFLENQLADKVLFFISPKLIGGKKAPGLFEGKGVASVQQAFRLKKISHFVLKNDIIIEGYF